MTTAHTSTTTPAVTKPSWPSEESFIQAANRIGCEVRTIKAFAKVESGSFGPFQSDGRCTILYERHVFDRLTNGRFRGQTIWLGEGSKARNYSLSEKTSGGYGLISHQREKLRIASNLQITPLIRANDSAHMACSWGLFQLMGENYQICGFETIWDFVKAMETSVEFHLLAFTNYCLNNRKRLPNGKTLLDALRSSPPDFLSAALIYNGPKQKGYGKRFQAAYEELG